MPRPFCERLHDRRAGAVAEEHAGGAIVPVDDRAQLLGADHEHRLRRATLDQPFGDRKPVQKSAARGGDVEAAAARLAPSSAWRSTAVAGRSRSGVAVLQDDDVDLAGVHAGALHRDARAAAPMLHVVSLGPAMWRSRMPVRSTIHSSSSRCRSRRSRGSSSPAREPIAPCRRSARPVASCARHCGVAEAAADVVVHARFDGAHGDLDRVLDRARRRLAVGDDADALHAEQRRAAVLGVVEPREAPRSSFLRRSPRCASMPKISGRRPRRT